MSKYIFSFGNKESKKIKNSRNILGGKGANLAEMARLGLTSSSWIYNFNTNV